MSIFNVIAMHAAGKGLALTSHEVSQVIVETVTQSTTTRKFSAAERFHDADSAKVVSSGAGLLKAQVNKDTTFTVDTTRAGRVSVSWSSVVFSRV